jgi:uracil-DNA glycosylase
MRRNRLGEPHIAPLELWARALESNKQEAVPSFDPESGGVAARALFLREEPWCKASEGPRFVSIDTNDLAAHNTWKAYALSGLDRWSTLHWNVVPWWVRNPAKMGGGSRTLTAQAKLAGRELQVLLHLLDRLELVVLLGRAAHVAWDAAGVRWPEVLACPHPSPLAWHQTDRTSGVKNGDLIIATFRDVAERLGNPVRATSETSNG